MDRPCKWQLGRQEQEDLRPGAQPQGVGAEHPGAVGVEAPLGNGPQC